MKRLAIWTILILSLLLVASFVWLRTSLRVEVGEHVKSVSWLPANASDITYSRDPGFFGFQSSYSYECKIPKEEFLKLSASEKWKLQQGKDLTIKLSNSHPVKKPNDLFRYISNGLSYNSPATETGSGIDVVFDLDSEHLFVSYNSY